MSYSTELPCALAETGGAAGSLPYVVLAVICVALGALLVLAARHAKSRERMARTFGAVVLIGGILLVSGVSAPAAEASEGGNACAEQAPTQSTAPPAPKPVTCAVLPEYLGSGSSGPTVFTEGDTTSMEGFWDTGQHGSLGFGEHFDTSVLRVGFGEWVSQVNAAGGVVELRLEGFDQYASANEFWSVLPQDYWWTVSTNPELSVPLRAVDSDTAIVEGGIDVPESISYAELVQLVESKYLETHGVEMPEAYRPWLQHASSLMGARGTVVASLPEQQGCPGASVSYPIGGPNRQ